MTQGVLIYGSGERIMGKYISRASSSQKGSVLIVSAILLPILLMMAGMVIDLGRSFAYKSELNKACMAAAEEASKTIDLEKAQQSGQNYLENDFYYIARDYFFANYKQKGSQELEILHISVSPSRDEPEFIEVACKGNSSCFFLRLIGIEDITVNSKALGRLRRIK